MTKEFHTCFYIVSTLSIVWSTLGVCLPFGCVMCEVLKRKGHTSSPSILVAYNTQWLQQSWFLHHANVLLCFCLWGTCAVLGVYSWLWARGHSWRGFMVLHGVPWSSPIQLRIKQAHYTLNSCSSLSNDVLYLAFFQWVRILFCSVFFSEYSFNCYMIIS